MAQPDDNETTTIGVTKGTKRLFDAEGQKGETSDKLLVRLLRELLDYRRRCG